MRKSAKPSTKKKATASSKAAAAKLTKQPKAGTTKAGADQRKRDFVNFFFIYNQNQTRAAIECGYSEASAANAASFLMKDPYISHEIKRRRDQLSNYIALTAEEVMRSLGRAIRFDPAKLYNYDGSLKKIHEMDEDTRLELEGADVEQRVSRTGAVTVNTAKVRYAKKSTARDQAMKHFRLFPSEKEQGNSDDEVPPPVAITIEFKDARLKKE